MRARLIVLIAVAAVAGCTSAATYHPPRSSAPPQHLFATAAVFVAVLRPHTANGSVLTYVFESTVCSQALRQPPCSPVPIPTSIQDQVSGALGPDVIFTAKPPTRLSPGGPIVVTLGAPHIVGDRATVAVETNCGPLCGEGQILVLGRRGDAWVRTGTTGQSWIS